MQHLLRKQIILIVLLVASSVSVFAQNDEVFQPEHDDLPYYLGMSIGLSNSYLYPKRGTNFLLATNDAAKYLLPQSTPYLNLGLTGTLKLTNRILIRVNPTLLISDSRIAFKYTTDNLLAYTPIVKDITGTIISGTTADDTLSYTIPSTIIDLPIAFKFQSDRYNAFKQPDMMRHYILAGAKFAFDLSSEKKPTKEAPTFPYENEIKGMDMSLELGLGLSFYLRYATISPELKFSYGLRDLRKTGSIKYPLLSGIDKVTSNFIYFTIHIEN
jgi:hypothetical protein